MRQRFCSSAALLMQNMQTEDIFCGNLPVLPAGISQRPAHKGLKEKWSVGERVPEACGRLTKRKSDLESGEWMTRQKALPEPS